MNGHPPRKLESLAGILIPPASREHALGDLAEGSRTSREYLANLASILPRVVWCQIRRRARLGGIIFNAVLTMIALTIALNPAGPFGAGQSTVGRAAVPWALWVIGCALAAAYGPVDRPTRSNPWLFALTVCVALGSAAILGVPVAAVAIGLGSMLGIILVLSMPFLTGKVPPPLTIDTLPIHARQFQRMIWWRNARESAAAVVVLAWNARDLWRADSWPARTGPMLIIAGVLFIVSYLYFRAGSRRVPDADATTVLRFHCHEIQRQRDILRRAPAWYLFPFVPGLAATVVAKANTAPPGGGLAAAAGFAGVAAIFALIWLLNVWAARFLDKQLQAVDALNSSTEV
jgi:hypothetical protein